eukprot:TRINITY_DN9529_c0_g2_i2.p1 TRINITY_DN9529_c0_g2~~TRINITY_DN9529_c0_g2_i2.p1  ORF type:complete len:164 (-),score=23.40 TRINITY_DN9529_c0_g2_i2:205-696(-)
MASASSPFLQAFTLPRAHRTTCMANTSKRAPPSHPAVLHGRRQWLLMLTATTAASTASFSPATAQDIPLFGLKKKLKQVEEEAEEIVKEGEEAVEKGIVAAEKKIITAVTDLETAEGEIVTEASFGIGGDFGQAGVVAGAEFLGVLIASSVVNGILGPDAQKP